MTPEARAIAAQALTRVGHALVPATPGDHHNHTAQPTAQLGLFKTEDAHGQEQEV